MNYVFEEAFAWKLIYVFEINDEAHKGLLKIGDATLNTKHPIDSLHPNCKILNKAAQDRIKQYTNTAGIQTKLLHTELAIITKKDKNNMIELKGFRDYDVHRVLKNSNISPKKIKNSTSKEWFEIDLETAIEAIRVVKNGKPNLGNITSNKFVPIIFRPEQKEAIKKTIKQFKTSNRMLWNAKMRFGKTLTTLELIKQCKFNKTIIITHRPVVDASWFEDFYKIFTDKDDYTYGSKNNGATINYLLEKDSNFIYFASIQDLRGSSVVGGTFDKNDEIFNIDWDLVVIDEAHEGTTTTLGNNVIKNIFKENENSNTKLLALSGTPFNILNDYDNDSVYTWDYVMEQKNKKSWDKLNFGDSNPYEELPELKIYTYDLGNIIDNKKYIELEDKAFNFKEFFRVWTGNIKMDHKSIPSGSNIGDFCNESDVRSFLNLITKEDEVSCYPYSNEEYRKIFKHSLWVIPGVKEAKALSKLLKSHPVFGNGSFDIINVAGDGDEEEKSEDALQKVRNGIKNAGEDGYTITLSCGKLTTGVTIPEWTAVFMLSGSFSTSASNYLQTIFRVQSPCNINGKFKQNCYVFDFAPDRTLKMVAESVTLSTKAGKAKESDKKIMGEFLNYCPVISVDGTRMKEYDTNKLLQQLKRAYAERAVQNGFDDVNLYNDELLKLDDIDINKFNNLKNIVGTSKAINKGKSIEINSKGFTEEEYEKIESIEKKSKKERTAEEEALLKELAERKKQKANAISILRSISIRIPLLIYGADVDINEDITIDNLTEIVDDLSWEEFMPFGVTKEIFKTFIKYYDAEIFIAAGRKIRNTIKAIDNLSPIERIQAIANLFSCFKNPDKETVLTPWRVVNMHIGDCLGGYNFYNDENTELIDVPRIINQDEVSLNTLFNKDARVLEINSKTGLYPLYVAYSIYQTRCSMYEEKLDDLARQQLWEKTIQDNIFIICKTPMAKSITKRTLIGFKNINVNAHYFNDLTNMMINKPNQLVNKILNPRYWKKDSETDKMKFNAVVGNPPYQLNDGGGDGSSAITLYHRFIEQAKSLNPDYISMIIPARWYSGGKGLDEFREEMLNDTRIRKIHDFPETKDCFSNVNIRGGVCYFLWDKEHDGDCEVTNHKNNKILSVLTRPLLEDGVSTFIRYNQAIDILKKVKSHNEKTMDTKVSSRNPFGIPSNYNRYSTVLTDTHNIVLYRSERGNNRNNTQAYINLDDVAKNREYIDKMKVIVSKASPGGDEYPHAIISRPITSEQNSVCTETYLIVDFVENQTQANNLISYMSTRFFRFMMALVKNTQNISKSSYALVPIQNWDEEWNDEKLYKKYGINKEEIEFIESMIKPMK